MLLVFPPWPFINTEPAPALSSLLWSWPWAGPCPLGWTEPWGACLCSGWLWAFALPPSAPLPGKSFPQPALPATEAATISPRSPLHHFFSFGRSVNNFLVTGPKVGWFPAPVFNPSGFLRELFWGRKRGEGEKVPGVPHPEEPLIAPSWRANPLESGLRPLPRWPELSQG